MRVQSLTLAAASAALLAPTAAPAVGVATARTEPVVRREGTVPAADLLARVRDCVPVSRGRYRADEDKSATIPV